MIFYIKLSENCSRVIGGKTLDKRTCSLTPNLIKPLDYAQHLVIQPEKKFSYRQKVTQTIPC